MENIIMSLDKTFKLLEENKNSELKQYLVAVYEVLEITTNENYGLRGENCILKDTIGTLKEIIRENKK